MGWKREAWAWWLPFVTMIRERWSLWSALHLMTMGFSWTEYSGGPLGLFQLPLCGHNHSFDRFINHPVPFRSSVCSVPQHKSSYHMKQKTNSSRSILSFRKHYGKALRRITTFQIPYCCWILPHPSFLIKKRAHRLKRGLASAQLWCGYKVLPRPEPNMSEN